MISSAKRLRVYQRDNFKCLKCGSSADLSLDHINPKSKGGSDAENNLRTYCKKCNGDRGSYTPSIKERLFGFMVTKKEFYSFKEGFSGTVSGWDKQIASQLQSQITKETNTIHLKFDKKFAEEKAYQDKVDRAVVELLSRFKALEEYLKIELFEGKEYRKKKNETNKNQATK